MPVFFSDVSTHPRRAQQIWQILVGCAHRRETLTYQLLAGKIGYRVPVAVAEPLYHIQYWCAAQGLPQLTVLVVNKETGKPGSGANVVDVDQEREAVFAYDWYNVVAPSAEELAAARTDEKASEKSV